MLNRWLTLTALLAASANPGRAAFTVAPTCRVKGHPELELTLDCGDGENAGVVQYWHTPFGDLQSPGSHSKLDPVFMHHDGSLVLHNTSTLHSGLYYCLLQHTEGTTLWPYQLHVSHDNKEYSKYEQHSSCGAFRFRRDVGSDAERQDVVSNGQFAGAVAASVLLTFVFGFSAGALSRTHVLRCLGAVATKVPSPWKRSQADTPDHASTVTMTTPPAMYDNQTFQMEQVEISPTNSPPPPKPQRSFRDKRREEQETTTYLEGCDYKQEEERGKEEVAGGSLEERNKGSVVEKEEERGQNGGSQTETDEESSEEVEKENGESREEITEEKEVEEAGEQENKNKEGEWSRGQEVEEKGSDEDREEEEEGQRSEKEEDGETGSNKQEDPEPATSPPRPSRRSRVIRLYQYDDDGQRYGHLPDPAPEEPGPAPRLKQRSLSLTRLSAIMTAASAGPLETEETGGEERTHFHMEI
ncbi:uncharacterized protein LOC115574896 [Sparus aurata]|uniref:uncharacterized protein LOC115574896 n=1 Tax=Sparus aurata TaxID=8175 RepID=UPI0011C18118|nr:uncharacterized protein LOC115574896 [Sparus aurata]